MLNFAKIFYLIAHVSDALNYNKTLAELKYLMLINSNEDMAHTKIHRKKKFWSNVKAIDVVNVCNISGIVI